MAKIRRAFLRILLCAVFLVVLVGGIFCTLVYFDILDVPIDELESEQEYNPKFSLSVYDVNDELYGDYDIDISGKEFNGWFKWGWSKKDYSKKISVDAAKEVKLALPQGDYTITVKDRANDNSVYKEDIFIREDSKNKKLSFRTSFGQAYAQEDDNNVVPEWDDYSPDLYQTSSERNIVLTLDVSGSMSGTPMEETKKASSNFVNTVLEQDASIGIVTYENASDIVSGFSTDRAALQSIVSGLYDGGGTNIEAGLRDAQWMLEKTDAKKKIIVLMSDGEPNAGLVREDLIAYADEIKETGTIIYTIGFFESLSERSYAQYLMECIASDGCHYEVANADQLSFFFEDMADQINGQKYIYARIACPVDVSVTYDGETLDSSEENLSARTSFGTLSFEENREKSDSGMDDRVKVLRLKDGADYDLKLTGNGHGIMNYTIGFMDDNGDYSDLRKFENIRITRKTRIDTKASSSGASILNIDNDGDGKYDVRLRAEANGYGEEITISKWMVYVIIGAAIFILLDIVAIIKFTKRKKRKGE